MCKITKIPTNVNSLTSKDILCAYPCTSMHIPISYMNSNVVCGEYDYTKHFAGLCFENIKKISNTVFYINCTCKFQAEILPNKLKTTNISKLSIKYISYSACSVHSVHSVLTCIVHRNSISISRYRFIWKQE